MDPRLLSFYNDELAYLREGAREFGEEHETVAPRLGLKTPTDPDPYVERLLEGVAFLGARVQLKISRPVSRIHAAFAPRDPAALSCSDFLDLHRCFRAERRRSRAH